MVATRPAMDPEGFLVDLSWWSRKLAEELAEKNQIGPLTEDHWRVIEFVNEYYRRYGEGPPIVKIAKHTGLKAQKICHLFPCGVVRGAYRLAGLPKPLGCV
jgi:tRNA 2-thiouridine synthesizing protein E